MYVNYTAFYTISQYNGKKSAIIECFSELLLTGLRSIIIWKVYKQNNMLYFIIHRWMALVQGYSLKAFRNKQPRITAARDL